MADDIWGNLDRAVTAYREAAGADGLVAEARALREELLARSQPVRELLDDMARNAKPDERGVVFTYKVDDRDVTILSNRDIRFTAGFTRVGPGETPELGFSDSTMTICLAHHEQRRPVATVQWHRGVMDADFALRKDKGWYQDGPFFDDADALASFTQALGQLQERVARADVSSLPAAPQPKP